LKNSWFLSLRAPREGRFREREVVVAIFHATPRDFAINDFLSQALAHLLAGPPVSTRFFKGGLVELHGG